MFDKIIAFFISILVFFFNLTAPAIPAQKSPEELYELSSYFTEKKIADTVYFISSFASQAERTVAISLQGLTAKESPAIYVGASALDGKYLKQIEENGSRVLRSDEDGKPWTLQKLLEIFSSSIKDGGYILYRAEGEGLNIATNYAALEGWLPVPVELEQTAINAGLVKKADISEDSYDAAYVSRFFIKNRHRFNKSFIIHQSTEAAGLRDLAIAQTAFIFFTDDDILGDVLLRRGVLDYFGDNTHILGWAKYEVAFVDSISQAGNMITAADHALNNSLLSCLPDDTPSHKAQKNTYTDSTKHYAALVMSDGDNLQWIQNGYSEFFQKTALEAQFPVTWSFSPLLKEFSPAAVKEVYAAAGDRDCFMCGVSGAGYMHPLQYPENALEGFTDKTAALMLESNLEYVQILDSTPENELDEAKLQRVLGYYSRYDNIKGGIISLDPDRYAGGEGKIYFSDGKPFMTYRLSLWHPANDASQVTREWLRSQAETVNSYPADINSINGYSVINIHPWSISVESLSYFVSCLDEDVVLVTVEELMEMITKNVPHVNAAPEE